MIQCEVERDAKVDGVLEGFVNSVKTFGLYPKGSGEFFKNLNGVMCRGVVRIK